MRVAGCLLFAILLIQPARPRAPIPPSAEHAYRLVAPLVDGASAMEIVRYMDQYWRLAGNRGFNASIDRIRAGLDDAGVTSRVEEFPNRGKGWDYTAGTVSFADSGEVLISRERDRVSLCINSFSTSPDGIDAPLVDVGRGGAAADYTGKDVKGAIVLGSASAGALWREAVVARGAIGVISTAVASYIRPEDPAKFTSQDQQDVFQWGSIPYDEARKAFGFKTGFRAASRMRERLKNGPVHLKVVIASSFSPGPNRMLISEVPGTSRPDERIVLVAHVQEPGANDNGSGCGTLFSLAVALHKAMASGRLRAPGRTLTFIWADEVAGSEYWLNAHPDQARGTQYMFALDMTGEDTTKTGGTFLIEKQPDPSAVWQRPSDPHTAWGASEVKAASLKGSLLNDLHLAICLRRAQDTGWVVKTNPYEGGSDHSAFGAAGIPALLDWHFTDRYYHTNLDRPEKTSAGEMTNVAVAVATSAWFLASATSTDIAPATALILRAAQDRLALEQRQGTTPEILTAWRKWYREALESIRRLSVDGGDVSPIDRAIAQLGAQ
jgi:aminopeptidase YwaD